MILSKDLTRLQERVPVQELIVAFLATYPYREQIKPIYPQVEVELLGANGIFSNVIGLCFDKLREKGLGKEEIWKPFYEEAISGDYQNLLKTCAKWFGMPTVMKMTNLIYDRLEAIHADCIETIDEIIKQEQCNLA